MNVIIRENMKNIILVASISLSLVSAASVNLSPRSVNVALETSFLFEPKDINNNIAFIKNIKVFLDKLYNILAPQARDDQSFRSEPLEKTRRFSFVDFIKNVGNSFMNLTDGKIEHAIKSLDLHVSKIANKSRMAIKEIFPTKHIKDYIEGSLRKWAVTDAQVLRNNLKKLVTDNNVILQNIGRRMDDYYNDDDIKKLNKILEKIAYKESKADLSKLIKEALHIGVLDKFKNLNETSRANLINDIKLLADFVKEKSMFNFNVEVNKRAPGIRKRTDSDLEISSSDKDTNDSIEKDVMYNELKQTIGNKLKLASKNLNDIRKGNEIIVDNVELFLQSAKYQ